MNFRKSLPPDTESAHFYDVYFDDLVKEPLGIVKKIYDHFGYEYTEEFEDKMTDWMQHNNTHTPSKKHDYSLEQYDLTAEQVQYEFSDYITKYFPHYEKKKQKAQSQP